jgi:uncharacterized protein (DUF1501 family)
MDTVTRRKFLIASGVVGGVAIAGGATAFTLKDVMDTAGWSDRPSDAKTLVVVTLYGGNDGINTVVPYADPAYQSARPELAYSAAEVLRIDDTLGFNPALKGLKSLYDAKQVAVVRGVGYPKPDRSHFRSMDIWQTAQPDAPGNTGWLGRWLDAVGGDPRHAVSFEPVLPPLLAGATTAGAAVPLTGLKLPSGVKPAVLTGFGKPSAGESALQARAARAFADLVEVDGMITSVKDAAGGPSSAASADTSSAAGNGSSQATGTGGHTALDGQLDLVAQCIEAGVATRVFSVSLGSFDTHADEKAPQQAQLARLDTALSAFTKRVAGRGVVTLVYSEFGRRVKANASNGTDHGTAAPMFVIGDGVKGGLHGEQPSLADLDAGDLKYSTDFRSVYATVLDTVLRIDPGKILNGYNTRFDGLF